MSLPCENLNLNLYRVFYIVAKTKSFSESSKVLHISQPAISKHIQNLEYELNTLLFYRTNRGIELTPEARNLVTYVEKAYNYLSLGEQELQQSKDLSKGKISIGLPEFSSVNYLNKYLKEYMNNYPSITIDIVYKPIKTLLSLLDDHNIDLLIIPGAITIPDTFKKVELTKEEYCFAYSKEYNQKEINSIKDLSNYKVILPSTNTMARKKLDDILFKYDLSIKPIMEVENSELIYNYISKGLGIGYIPGNIIDDSSNIEKAKIEEPLPVETINLVYNEKSLTIASKTLVELLENNEDRTI
jgi:DNA-binding transcriptional LysR family regulator